jgi:CHAT domain-containing protein
MIARVWIAALLMFFTFAAAAQPADSITTTYQDFKKAKSKEDRQALLARKEAAFITEIFLKVLADHAAFLEQDKYGEADRALMWADEVVELLPNPHHRELCHLICMFERGKTEQVRQRYAEAAAIYKELLPTIRKRKDTSWMEPLLVGNLGTVQCQQGDFLGSLRTLQDARTLLTKLEPDSRRKNEISLLGNLGAVHLELGELRDAEKAFKDSLRLAAESSDDSMTRNIRGNLARLDIRRGRYREGIAAYQQLLAEARKARDRRMEATLSNNLALALEESGRTGESLLRLEEARKLAADLGSTHTEAVAIGNLSLRHLELGNIEDAAHFNEQAMKLFAKVGDQSGIAECYKAQGMIHLEAHRIEDAEKAFGAGLASLQAGGRKAAIAEMESMIGLLYVKNRQWARAKQLFTSSLATFRELEDPRRSLLVQQGLLDMMRQTSDPRYHAEYVDFRARALRANDPHAVAHAAYCEALDLLLAEKWEEAEAAAEKLLSGVEQRLELTLDPQIRSARSRGSLVDGYLILAAARAGHSDAAGAWLASERAKARSLMGVLQRDGGIHAGMTDQEKDQEELLRTAVVAASRKLESIREFGRSEQKMSKRIEESLADAQSRYEAFRSRLYVDHPGLRTHMGDVPAVDLAELQKQLFDAEPDLAIISYLVDFDRTMIFVLTAGEKPSEPARVDLHTVKVDQKALEEAAEEFTKACQAPGTGRPKSDDLWKWLIAPAEKELAGKKHLVIVPFTPLLTLPFQALAPDTRRETPFLIERHAVSYAPSVTALMKMRERGDVVRRRGNADRTLLAIGGVSFAPDLKELQHSGPEAESVAQVFGPKSRLLMGNKATRRAISEAAPAAKVIHFATHGLPNGRHPLFSAIAITPDNDDGRLYGYDILDLKLSAELVVLSACETARGREFRGEGTIGLAWSLFVAGAPAVVVSQWSVDDEATGNLMQAFHEMARGELGSRAESLRQAQLKMLKKRSTRHPFFWAPFILTGDWRR